jgi:hypothetical protein
VSKQEVLARWSPWWSLAWRGRGGAAAGELRPGGGGAGRGFAVRRRRRWQRSGGRAEVALAGAREVAALGASDEQMSSDRDDEDGGRR